MKPRRSWLPMLRTARAAILVLVAGGLALTLPSQTTDMLAFVGNAQPSDWLRYQVALVILGGSGWFWSRAALTAQYGTCPSDIAAQQIDWFAYRWVPRFPLVITSAIGITIALDDHGFWTAGGAAAISAGAVLLARWRTLGINRRYRLGDPLEPQSVADWFPGGAGTRLYRLIVEAPGGAWIAVPLLSCSLLVLVLGVAEAFTPALQLPARLAAEFPGPGVAILGLGLMIGPLVTMTFVIDGINATYQIGYFRFGFKRPPVLTVLAFYVFVAMPAVTHLHPVRLRADKLLPKATLSEIFADWTKVCAPRGEIIRPVIVAISGGATRAGLWGVAVLDRVLQSQQPDGPALFAVSSVSGGSLGAAGAMSLLRQEPLPCRAQNLSALAPLLPGQPTPLAGDALGPLLAGWLVDDIPRAFTYPLAFLVRGVTGWTFRGGDSASAIEQAFADLWDQVRPCGAVAWDDPYLSLFYTPSMADERPPYRVGMPLWFANGTDATTGNRVITSPINAVDGPWPFRGARDFHALMHADARIATVINNTARFAYLEPFGEMLPAAPNGPAGSLEDQSVGSLIDGGYFENEGLQTALDLAEWLTSHAPPGRQVRPIIVEATGDGEADVMAPDVMTCAVASDGPDIPGSQHSIAQLLAPLIGLYHVRGGHSSVLLRQAHDNFCGTRPGEEKRPRFVHFYLPADHGQPVPLNWVLSEASARFIWTAFSDRQVCNAGQLATLASAMAASTEAPPMPLVCPASGMQN